MPLGLGDHACAASGRGKQLQLTVLLWEKSFMLQGQVEVTLEGFAPIER